jgi:hypothetical protein
MKRQAVSGIKETEMGGIAKQVRGLLLGELVPDSVRIPTIC